MIEIILTMSVKPSDTYQNIDSHSQMLIDHYNDLHSFFKKHVEQNTILNYFSFDGVFQESNSMVSAYFTTSAENAQIFIDAMLDTSAEFSPFNMWDENGFQVDFRQQDVTNDTDVSSRASLLFDSNDIMWSSVS